MTENLIPEYDKSKWAKGEWDNEPDRIDFIHSGFSCFILRNHVGSLCGYVGVPKEHPTYGRDYGDINVDVHGGLTYSDRCAPPICHIPNEGMPDNVWWFGFDAGHFNDISPLSYFPQDYQRGSYKNVNYMINETKKLAEQLSQIK